MADRLYVLLVALLLGVVPLAGCRQNQTPKSTREKLQIMVSIAPQKYFVERIGGDYVTANAMVPSGAEPHTFEPKPEQLRTLSQVNAYIRIRVDFEEAWMNKFAGVNPNMLIVDTTEGIERMPMTAHDHEEGEERHTGEGENLDPHIWLSPRLVKVQARAIYDALLQLDSDREIVYKQNLERFLGDIDKLDAEITKTLAGMHNRKFIVFHPAWGYFARDYGLEMIPVEVGGTEPSAAELAALITEAKQDKIKVIFAEPQFSKKAAETIASEIGAEVLFIDPLSPDWLDNLRNVVNTFAKVLSQGRVIHLQSIAIALRASSAKIIYQLS